MNDTIATRFRGFLPVVIDVETGGFNSTTDALLEIAAVTVKLHADGHWSRDVTHSYNVKPFEGANMEQEALDFTGIDPYHPFRMAVDEKQALSEIFDVVQQAVADHSCTRAILVGHNAHFDLGFINQAVQRTRLKKNPLHAFSTLDTASLSALAYGQTVLAKSVQAAGLDWDPDQAHSALYDAERTADLFCTIVNRWRVLNRS
jgi:ribonuclease T